ncbi:MAG: IS701 family transposase [Gemmatimonadota bacterium]|nr:IS701 family transposase [Gemmatimonadota bacterium]
MSKRIPATPAPAPLEGYCERLDDLFTKRAQRECLRRYLEGILLPRERNKTLTALAHTQPVLGACDAAAQRLQWFLSESTWSPDALHQRRIELLIQDPQTAPHAGGVLVIDETGDRKWGSKTAHMGRQYLGSIGKTDSGVVSVTSLWADERVYYPLHVEPYTPAHWFTQGKEDSDFRTKPKIAGELVARALALGIPFRAVVADSLYGEHRQLKAELKQYGVGFVLALKPSHDWRHPADEIGTVREAAQAAGARWKSAQEPGLWSAVERRFRDGHTETWWALEAECGPFSVLRHRRLVVATTDPKRLPDQSTWYLETNLPRSGVPATKAARSEAGAEPSPHRSADCVEVVRLYGLRNWVEQGYKQVKHELGWADYQVRSDVAIRRHWALVCCAFSFCWWVLPSEPEPAEPTPALVSRSAAEIPVAERGENGGGTNPRRRSPAVVLAGSTTPCAGVAYPVGVDYTLVACLVGSTPARPSRGHARIARGRQRNPPLQPVTTDHR